MSACQNVLLHEENKGGYSLALIAKFEEPYPVSYIIRATTPKAGKFTTLALLKGSRI